MSNQLEVTLKGFVGSDPVVHTARNSSAVVVIRLGHSSRRRRSDGTFEDETQWFDVKCFGRLAQNVRDSVRRGHPLIVRGRLVTERWTTAEGEERSRMAVIASAIGMEMSYGVVTYNRVKRESPQAEESLTHNAASMQPLAPAESVWENVTVETYNPDDAVARADAKDEAVVALTDEKDLVPA
ncbi:MAG: single-stranded DNA-binding protein [Bowdeniella nasicola]|nr:single-stranded DNA-binding protein [Bowdeniella nasicola]